MKNAYSETISASKVEFNAEHSGENEKAVLEMGLKHREEFGCENGYETWEWVKISLVGVQQIGKITDKVKGEYTNIKRLYVQKSSGIQFCIEEFYCMGCSSVKLLPKTNFHI